MKSSVILFLSLIVLAITVLSAPIPYSEGLLSTDLLAMGFGFVGVFFGASLTLTAIASYLRGQVNNVNNRLAIDHYFNHVKQWELEKLAMRQIEGRNKTTSINEKAVQRGSDTEGFENPAAVLARARWLLKEPSKS
jgi:hypothetical protein